MKEIITLVMMVMVVAVSYYTMDNYFRINDLEDKIRFIEAEKKLDSGDPIGSNDPLAFSSHPSTIKGDLIFSL